MRPQGAVVAAAADAVAGNQKTCLIRYVFITTAIIGTKWAFFAHFFYHHGFDPARAGFDFDCGVLGMGDIGCAPTSFETLLGYLSLSTRTSNAWH